MHKEGANYIFDTDDERRLMDARSWPITDVIGLVATAEHRLDIIAGTDWSEFPAGANRAGLIAKQWHEVGVLGKIIQEASPKRDSAIVNELTDYLRSR